MRVIDPQSAVLTNIEVLAYLTANPPRRPPNPPPNSRHWVPSPDLRDHNTVVKEIHNYVTRLSPHLQKYPRYTTQTHSSTTTGGSGAGLISGGTTSTIPAAPDPITATATTGPLSDTPTLPPPTPDSTPTPIDHALRTLVAELQPYGLTKAEVIMILNLGVGVVGSSEMGGERVGGLDGEDGDGGGGMAEHMVVDGYGDGVNGNGTDERNGEQEEEEDEDGEDYGALALLDTVIEDREERLSSEDVVAVLAAIRRTLGFGVR
ncbi:uncharacterized protein PFLUO_LOCUS1664 [Penicillium psychrofluorescens]|uniref:uncharacterized protein n=1 Tax=Penicillium psychrofluorescens TaxID=3158075 RepID=UPI003CCD6F8F